MSMYVEFDESKVTIVVADIDNTEISCVRTGPEVGGENFARVKRIDLRQLRGHCCTSNLRFIVSVS